MTIHSIAASTRGSFSIPSLLQEVVRVPAFLAGLATLPVALCSLLLAERFGQLAGRHGARSLMTAGPLVAAAGFAWMSLTGPDAASLWLHLGAGLALYGLGLAMTVAPLTATVLDAVPPDRSGVASATNNATARVAGLVAVGVLGTVAGDVFDLAAFQRAALTTAAFFALGAITAFVGVRAAPRRPDASGPEPATIPTEEENSGRSV